MKQFIEDFITNFMQTIYYFIKVWGDINYYQFISICSEPASSILMPINFHALIEEDRFTAYWKCHGYNINEYTPYKEIYSM